MVFLPFQNLIRTTPFDREMAELADRHYSRRKIGSNQFLNSGKKIVLRDSCGLVLFAWILQKFRFDGRAGFNCAIFRNESSRRSSEIILEAERIAVAEWGPGLAFTFIDPRKIKSRNPGFCFKCAGWKFVGLTAGNKRPVKHILEKHLF